MAEVKDVVVPDIGDFTEVPVVEVLVSVGDEVGVDVRFTTTTFDKVSMD